MIDALRSILITNNNIDYDNILCVHVDYLEGSSSWYDMCSSISFERIYVYQNLLNLSSICNLCNKQWQGYRNIIQVYFYLLCTCNNHLTYRQTALSGLSYSSSSFKQDMLRMDEHHILTNNTSVVVLEYI